MGVAERDRTGGEPAGLHRTQDAESCLSFSFFFLRCSCVARNRFWVAVCGTAPMLSCFLVFPFWCSPPRTPPPPLPFVCMCVCVSCGVCVGFLAFTRLIEREAKENVCYGHTRLFFSFFAFVSRAVTPRTRCCATVSWTRTRTWVWIWAWSWIEVHADADADDLLYVRETSWVYIVLCMTSVLLHG